MFFADCIIKVCIFFIYIMNPGVIIAGAIGLYLMSDSSKKAVENNKKINQEIADLKARLEESESLLSEYDDKFESVTTPYDIDKAIQFKSAMMGISSISDKYMNCAAGLIVENTGKESVNVKINSGTFKVAGYQMDRGAEDLRTVTVPAQKDGKPGRVYIPLFAWENKILWNSKEARTQVRLAIGEAQGHKGREARSIWGKASVDCEFNFSYSLIGTFSGQRGKTITGRAEKAKMRYYNSTALKNRLEVWVYKYLWN